MEAKQLQATFVDPAAYRRSLTIDSNGEPKRLAEVVEPWQETDFVALDAGWQVVAGVPVTAGVPVLRCWFERPRGHSKTSDAAVMFSWAMYAAKRPLRGVVVAGDIDQARIILDAVETLCRLNPHVARMLEVKRNVVTNRRTGSECKIVSSDADTSFGLLPDFVWLDELTHWADGAGEDLFSSLISSAAKRQNCFCGVGTNAGRGKGSSWHWRVREAARVSADWYFSRMDGPQASFLGNILAEQEKFLPPTIFARYWMNVWSTGSGDFLEPAALEDCVCLRGPMAQRPEGDWGFVAGLDLSATRDHSALVILGSERGSNMVTLCDAISWKPPSNGEGVDLHAIELAVHRAHVRYGLTECRFDPWQGNYLAQNLRRKGVNMQAVVFSNASQATEMAAALLETVNARALRLYRHEQLLRDLAALSIVERQAGYKIEATRTSDGGHCDLAIALAIALPSAVRLAHAKAVVRTAPIRCESKNRNPARFGVLLDQAPRPSYVQLQGSTHWPHRR